MSHRAGRSSAGRPALSGVAIALAAFLFVLPPVHGEDVAPVLPDTPAAQPAEPAELRAPRRARNVDLDAPVSDPARASQDAALEKTIEQGSEALQSQSLRDIGSLESGELQQAGTSPFVMLGTEVLPGTASRLAWQPEESFAGIASPTPVLVVHGVESGPVLCLTAAVHGDELNGIEIVRRVMYDLDPTQLKGTVVGVPIVNLMGFKRSSRYLPDRRDLNRHFPGNPVGSSASRIAYSFFNDVVRRCSFLVDVHTGSFYRTNLPQLRADLGRADVVAVAESFTSTAVIHSPGARGSLRRAAVDAGIPSVTLEAGEPMRLQADEVEHGARGIFGLIDQLGMYRKLRVWGNPAPVHYRSRWVRADSGGILFGRVELGQQVRAGDLLGTVTDPITNVRADILSPWEGRVIGMAVDQVVMPGFAAFHIGIKARTEELVEPGDGEEDPEADGAGVRDGLEDS